MLCVATNSPTSLQSWCVGVGVGGDVDPRAAARSRLARGPSATRCAASIAPSSATCASRPHCRSASLPAVRWLGVVWHCVLTCRPRRHRSADATGARTTCAPSRCCRRACDGATRSMRCDAMRLTTWRQERANAARAPRSLVVGQPGRAINKSERRARCLGRRCCDLVSV